MPSARPSDPRSLRSDHADNRHHALALQPFQRISILHKDSHPLHLRGGQTKSAIPRFIVQQNPGHPSRPPRYLRVVENRLRGTVHLTSGLLQASPFTPRRKSARRVRSATVIVLYFLFLNRFSAFLVSCLAISLFAARGRVLKNSVALLGVANKQ